MQTVRAGFESRNRRVFRFERRMALFLIVAAFATAGCSIELAQASDDTGATVPTPVTSEPGSGDGDNPVLTLPERTTTEPGSGGDPTETRPEPPTTGPTTTETTTTEPEPTTSEPEPTTTEPEPVTTEPPPAPEPVWERSPAGHFCVVNRVITGITVAEPQIKNLNPLFQYNIEPASVEAERSVPVRRCLPVAELDQRRDIEPEQTIWLKISWGSFDFDAPDPVRVPQNTFKYADLCGLIDIQANGAIEIEYEGQLQPGDDPDPDRVRCTRYNRDGVVRAAVYGPTTAKWEGRTHCDTRYPAGNGWEAAFAHLTSGYCYQCPTGFSRTVWDLKGSTACEKGGFIGIGAEHAHVRYAGPECGNPATGRQNFRNGITDQCYSCPANWSTPGFGYVSFDLTESYACWPPDWPY